MESPDPDKKFWIPEIIFGELREDSSGDFADNWNTRVIAPRDDPPFAFRTEFIHPRPDDFDSELWDKPGRGVLQPRYSELCKSIKDGDVVTHLLDGQTTQVIVGLLEDSKYSLDAQEAIFEQYEHFQR